MELATFIGLLILAGSTLISFITVFVKVGGRFSIVEEKVLNLEKERDKQDTKLDLIQKSINDLIVRVAILDENIKNKKVNVLKGE